jgi:sulfatase modifying factor 1
VTTRREFIQQLGAAVVAVAPDRGLENQAALRTPVQGAQAALRTAFHGAQAGEIRLVEGVRLCWCPAGRFTMGSPANEAGRRGDEGQVSVQITRGFWTARTEVTQGEWRRIVGDFPERPPSAEFGRGDDMALYWVNYTEAELFCARLTARAHSAGSLPKTWAFKLPTEAQWEYACRAGTTTAFAFGDRLTREQANIGGEPRPDGSRGLMGRGKAVGSYAPNAWGICDMHGNIFEWCRDWYHPQLPGGVDPDLSGKQGSPNGDGTFSRCRRGGAWNDPAEFCRSAMRLRYEPHRRSDHIGFRVVAVEAD